MKLNNIVRIFYISISALPLDVYAAGINVFKPTGGITTLRTPDKIIQNGLCFIPALIFNVLIILSIIMVLYAAYIYLTSSGDTTKISTATKTITYAAIAVAVALVAISFPYIIASIFGTKLNGGCFLFVLNYLIPI